MLGTCSVSRQISGADEASRCCFWFFHAVNCSFFAVVGWVNRGLSIGVAEFVHRFDGTSQTWVVHPADGMFGRIFRSGRSWFYFWWHVVIVYWFFCLLTFGAVLTSSVEKSGDGSFIVSTCSVHCFLEALLSLLWLFTVSVLGTIVGEKLLRWV